MLHLAVPLLLYLFAVAIAAAVSDCYCYYCCASEGNRLSLCLGSLELAALATLGGHMHLWKLFLTQIAMHIHTYTLPFKQAKCAKTTAIGADDQKLKTDKSATKSTDKQKY